LGLFIYYYLKNRTKTAARIHIADPYGTQVKTIDLDPRQGINRTIWTMVNEEDERVPPGDYVVTLEIGEDKLMRRARIVAPSH
jgi:hypothetical protein